MSEEIKKPLTEISDEEKYAIKRRSAYILPDNPSERGWTAENIKKAFYELICAEDNSVLALLSRIITDGNVAFEDHENKMTALEKLTKEDLQAAKDSGEFDGVSVRSVEQTVTSEESGGENEITVTLSNDKVYVFKVKNGIRGEKGEKGETGDKGDSFAIDKIYASIEEMNDGYASDGVAVGRFVVIETGNVDDEDNAKLFIKGDTAYEYLTDLSGREGIQGPQGIQGEAGKSAYDYATEGGYGGTEEAFGVELASIPSLKSAAISADKRIDVLEAAADGKLWAVDENFPSYVEDTGSYVGVYTEYYPQALVSRISINNTDGLVPYAVVCGFDDTGWEQQAYGVIPESIRNHAAFCKPYLSHGITFEGETVVDFENGYITRSAKSASLPSNFIFYWLGNSDYDFYLWYDDFIITEWDSGEYSYTDADGEEYTIGIDSLGAGESGKIYGWLFSDHANAENIVRNIVSNASIPATIAPKVPIVEDMPITVQAPPYYYNYALPTVSVTDSNVQEELGYLGDCPNILNNSSATIKAYAKL